MKKKLILLLFTAAIALNSLMAQDTTTTWLNTLDEVVGQETAPFYSLGWKADGKWHRHVHFRFGPLYQSGQFVDSTCTIKSGEFITYNKHGAKLSEAHYKANSFIDTYALWYDDGTLSAKGQFAESKIMKETTTAPDDYWNPEEASEIIPADEEGQRIGRWEYYHPNGQLSAAYEYDTYGNLISTEYWQSDGSPGHTGDTVEKLPQFPGGDQAMMKFLGEHIQYPIEDRNAGRSGEVLISFVVDRNGEVTDPRIERSVSPTMNQECIRLLTLMPLWIPGRSNNRNEELRYYLPVRFTNVTARGHRKMMKKIEEGR